ncbi:MAG TPA: ABC transporter ATP-binding protein [Anaerolineales bacterium]|nr:ABC transporter ATP-binding protein [Anaerolineales bacterium]
MTTTTNQKDIVLDVKGLKTHFFTEDGVVKSVDGVDFYVRKGEVLGLVGESGCGKSVTSLSILRLIPVPGQILAGEIYFHGQDILKYSEAQMLKLRGNRISMIFQQPQSALNPVYRVGEQIAEVLQLHEKMTPQQANTRAIELMKQVGIPDPAKRARNFPHELSGGMLQRIMIAMALSCNPELLIADEPTTALDVTIQAQILDLMRGLKKEFDTAIIFITHDLGVVAEMCDRVAVMYAGQIVEQTDVFDLFENPQHPYTQGLIASIPVLGEIKERLATIPGAVPNLIKLPPGCRFASRCQSRLDYGLEICNAHIPNLVRTNDAHAVRCWLYEGSAEHQAPMQVKTA